MKLSVPLALYAMVGLSTAAAVPIERDSAGISIIERDSTDNSNLEKRRNCLPYSTNGYCKNYPFFLRYQLNFHTNGKTWDWSDNKKGTDITIQPSGVLTRGSTMTFPTTITIQWHDGTVRSWWTPDLRTSCPLGRDVQGIKNAWVC